MQRTMMVIDLRSIALLIYISRNLLMLWTKIANERFSSDIGDYDRSQTKSDRALHLKTAERNQHLHNLRQTHIHPAFTDSLSLAHHAINHQSTPWRHYRTCQSYKLHLTYARFFRGRRRSMFGYGIWFTLIQVCIYSYSSLGICYPGLGF